MGRLCKTARGWFGGHANRRGGTPTPTPAPTPTPTPSGPVLAGAFSPGMMGTSSDELMPIVGGTPPYTLEVLAGGPATGYTLSISGANVRHAGADNS